MLPGRGAPPPRVLPERGAAPGRPPWSRAAGASGRLGRGPGVGPPAAGRAGASGWLGPGAGRAWRSASPQGRPGAPGSARGRARGRGRSRGGGCRLGGLRGSRGLGRRGAAGAGAAGQGPPGPSDPDGGRARGSTGRGLRGGGGLLGGGLLAGRGGRGVLLDPAHDRGLDGRARGLHELAHLLQMRQQIFAGHAELLGELVDTDLSHVSPSPGPRRLEEGADRRQCRGMLIAEYSSGAHQRQTRSRCLFGRFIAARGLRPRTAGRRSPRGCSAAPGRRPGDERRGRSTGGRGGAMPHVPAPGGAGPARGRSDRPGASPRQLAARSTGYPCRGTRCRSAKDPKGQPEPGVQSGRSPQV